MNFIPFIGCHFSPAELAPCETNVNSSVPISIVVQVLNDSEATSRVCLSASSLKQKAKKIELLQEGAKEERDSIKKATTVNFFAQRLCSEDSTVSKAQAEERIGIAFDLLGEH